MLQVLNINYNDVIGGQFNNFECRHDFANHNIRPYFFVIDKLSTDDSVQTVWSRFKFLRRYVHGAVYKIEQYFSVQSLLYPTPLRLAISRYFRGANIVHYHIIHNGWFSILAMPWLTRKKLSVWTIHDPWIVTGHCIYPMSCEGWKTGCGGCPQLNLPLTMRKDRTASMFRLKQKLFAKLPKVKFVVASRWMETMLKQSPICKDLDITVIPFGINLEIFKPRDNKQIREELDIPQENIVLFFRSNNSPYKGVAHIKEAIHKLIAQSPRPITIMTVEGQGHFDEFIGKCQVVEHAWEQNVEKLSSLYSACDIFLMPSTAEAFGLMAIEAMASGKPVVFFSGTSLDEITFAPEGGAAVRMGDSEELTRVIFELINDDKERTKLGKQARALAEKHYDVNLYLERMSKFYKDIHYKSVAEAGL